jgi:predicted MPP superfamily phosphohydrolase
MKIVVMKKLLLLSSILILSFCNHISAPPTIQELYNATLNRELDHARTIMASIQPYLDGTTGPDAKVFAEKAKERAEWILDAMSRSTASWRLEREAASLKDAGEKAQRAAEDAYRSAVTYIQQQTQRTSPIPPQQPRKPSPTRTPVQQQNPPRTSPEPVQQPRTPSPARSPREIPFEQASAAIPTLTTWTAQCNQLPFLQKTAILKMPETTIVPIPIFTALMDHLIANFNATKNTRDWLTPLSENTPAYVQKDIASLWKPIYFHADFHGDVKSLIAFLQDLKNQNIINDQWQLVAKGNKIVFLGDYIDRGFYGLEVVYTLMILKIINPQNVYVLRGNHEERGIYTSYNSGEILQKLQSQNINPTAFFNKLDAFFDTLPSALYIKMPNNRFLLFTHGAHNHTDTMLKEFLASPKNYNAFALSDDGSFNAYSWNDYNNAETAITAIDIGKRGSGYEYNKIPTIAWMNEHAVDTIIHGHQHTQTQLWGADEQERDHNPKGRVYGLPITPDTTYGKALGLMDDMYGSIVVNNATLGGATRIKLERKRIIPS